MKIIQLIPGSGDNFYCENCLRDNAVTAALRRAGHEVDILPLYLPPTTEGLDRPVESPIFFGGINAYLQQKSALFRRTPRWLDAALDARPLLRWAGKHAGMTSPRDLGEMTLSMLRGEDGRQAKELDRLVAFLAGRERPDVAVLSNALLAGLARRIVRELGVPVLCWLQDEDGFLDSLPEPYDAQSWRTLADRAGDIAGFLGPTRYYADVMTRRLGLPPDRVHIVHNGIDVAGFAPSPARPDPPAIGFLAHMSRPKGLDLLAEAYIKLRERHPGLKLRMAGGKTGADDKYLVEVAQRLAEAGAGDGAEFVPGLERETRAEFLRSLSVLSVPTRGGEAFGLYVLESLAAGVPLVLPRHGSFPELIEATGGGILCEPNDADSLAAALDEVLSDPERAGALAAAGREAVRRDFAAERVAERFIAVCEQVAGERTRTT